MCIQEFTAGRWGVIASKHLTNSWRTSISITMGKKEKKKPSYSDVVCFRLSEPRNQWWGKAVSIMSLLMNFHELSLIIGLIHQSNPYNSQLCFLKDYLNHSPHLGILFYFLCIQYSQDKDCEDSLTQRSSCNWSCSDQLPLIPPATASINTCSDWALLY